MTLSDRVQQLTLIRTARRYFVCCLFDRATQHALRFENRLRAAGTPKIAWLRPRKTPAQIYSEISRPQALRRTAAEEYAALEEGQR
jgi:hypothetical protein